ncbi:MAG: SusC/RagA family TonB-linked outer membrane protein [Bacteroidales bacterium]|nr:SusC/RagA family TonB-linked outer membrane protein [Bacteroidales bacterium]
MKRFVFVLSLLLFVGFNLLQAQGVQVTGNVTSAEDGTALPGVSVVVRGTTIGAVTDFEGNFTITVPDASATLMFSFVGMITQEIALDGQTVVNVILESSTTALDEVVVTALGMTRSQKSLGYSVQSVESEEISKANTSDIINSIAGRTAGVQITSSAGTPGASTYMTIRGAASITGNNQPLFVVDGMPIVTGIGRMAVTNRDPYSTGGTGSSSRSIDLNPEDIASMTVLKGGAATALYGVRAANGAIIITTKSGAKAAQKMKVDFHTSVGFDKVSQLPPRQNQFVQGNNGNWIGGFSRSWGPNVDTLQYDVTTDPDYKWDENGMTVGQSDPNANGIPVKMYDAYDYFETGVTFNNRLSVSAGNDVASYFFSIADLEQTGIVPNSSFARTNVRLNSTAKLTNWARISTNMTYSNSRANQIQQGSNTSGVMLGLVRTPPSFDNSAGYEFPDGSQRNYRNGGGYDNPYWTSNKNWLDDNTNRFIGNAIVNFTFTDWFSASYNLGIDTYTRQTMDVIAIGSRTRPAGAVEEGSRTERQINSDLLLNFQKSFGDLDAKLTVGNNMFETGWKRVWGDAEGLEIPGFYQLSNSSDNQTGVSQSKYRTAAVFADVQLAYMDMIFLGATGRNDWATTMPEENLSAFYPSVSLGFVFTELGALQGNSILSFGKLRGSWAQTANIATPYNTTNYFYSATARGGWTNGVQFPYMDQAGFDVGYTMGNPDLKHETMQSFEIGADLRFMNNRVGVDFSYFQNTNTDLLLEVPIAESSGYGELYMNAAEMESKGIEVSANARVLQGEFSWDIMANFTKMTNTVVSLAEGVESIGLGGFTIPQTRAVAGRQYGSIYGNDWYRDPATGAVLINDDPSDAYRDGYPMTDTRQMVPVGDVNPDWTANITNTFSYMGFRLSFMFDIKVGGWMYNGTAFAMNYFGVHGRTANREVYYTPEGTIDFSRTPEENLKIFDGVYGHVAADGTPVSSGVTNVSPVVLDENWFEGFGSNFGGGAQTASMEPADWVRLRELSFAYMVPVQNKVFQSVEIYFTGRNLWLSTPYTGIDPESNLQGAINGQGMDYFNMPGTKTYTVGLKLSF